jgi:putative ATPase
VRNAPTGLLKELGYGKGYRYDPDEPEGFAAGQQYLPEPLRDARWYEPTDDGYERQIRERLARWARIPSRVPPPIGDGPNASKGP